MSITTQVAVCITVVQKPLSNRQLVTKQATVTRKRYSWQLGSCHCHSLPIIHIWNWPVVQNERIDFNHCFSSFLFFFYSTVFSHYLLLMLHRDFTHLSILSSNLAINHSTQRASGISQVSLLYDFQETAVSRHSGRNKSEMVLNWCHLITFCHICIDSNSALKEMLCYDFPSFVYVTRLKIPYVIKLMFKIVKTLKVS